MADDGFLQLMQDLQELSKLADENTKLEALEAGSQVIVDRAKRVISSHTRTGRLEGGIVAEYNARDKTMDIGYNADAFYGVFLDDGFNHVGGQRVQVPHLKSSFDSEKENVFNKMLDVYKRS